MAYKQDYIEKCKKLRYGDLIHMAHNSYINTCIFKQLTPVSMQFWYLNRYGLNLYNKKNCNYINAPSDYRIKKITSECLTQEELEMCNEFKL